MTINKTFQGGYLIEKEGFKMQYLGYSKKEAVTKFKAEYKAQK